MQTATPAETAQRAVIAYASEHGLIAISRTTPVAYQIARTVMRAGVKLKRRTARWSTNNGGVISKYEKQYVLIEDGTYNIILDAFRNKLPAVDELGRINFVRALYGLEPRTHARSADADAQTDAKGAKDDRTKQRAAYAAKMLARAQKQLDSAEKRVRKWAAKVKYYQKRMEGNGNG